MATYISMTGRAYDDDDIERWAEAAERGEFQGTPGPAYYGPMPSPTELAADIALIDAMPA